MAARFTEIEPRVSQVPGLMVWGAWAGLFGLASDELILILVHPSEHSSLALPQGWTLVSQQQLRATVRPTQATPERRPGVYVFREFATTAQRIDELVQLSTNAWKTFEQGQDYDALPIGLFAPSKPSGECTMLLLTWYPDFTAWQRSRKPDPRATKSFLARRALTSRTLAIATRSLL